MRPFRILAVILMAILLADIGCILKLEYEPAKTTRYIEMMEKQLSE